MNNKFYDLLVQNNYVQTIKLLLIAILVIFFTNLAQET